MTVKLIATAANQDQEEERALWILSAQILDGRRAIQAENAVSHLPKILAILRAMNAKHLGLMHVHAHSQQHRAQMVWTMIATATSTVQTRLAAQKCAQLAQLAQATEMRAQLTRAVQEHVLTQLILTPVPAIATRARMMYAAVDRARTLQTLIHATTATRAPT